MDADAVWLLGRIALLVLVAAAAVSAQDAALKRPRSKPLARYRHRLLRAYDEQTAEPIEGLEVMDVISGDTALTARAGTVSLAFLPDGGSLVRLRKAGYAAVTITAAISPTDTVPLTVLMQRTTRRVTAAAARPAPVGRSRSA